MLKWLSLTHLGQEPVKYQRYQCSALINKLMPLIQFLAKNATLFLNNKAHYLYIK